MKKVCWLIGVTELAFDEEEESEDEAELGADPALDYPLAPLELELAASTP